MTRKDTYNSLQYPVLVELQLPTATLTPAYQHPFIHASAFLTHIGQIVSPRIEGQTFEIVDAHDLNGRAGKLRIAYTYNPQIWHGDRSWTHYWTSYRPSALV